MVDLSVFIDFDPIWTKTTAIECERATAGRPGGWPGLRGLPSGNLPVHGFQWQHGPSHGHDGSESAAASASGTRRIGPGFLLLKFHSESES